MFRLQLIVCLSRLRFDCLSVPFCGWFGCGFWWFVVCRCLFGFEYTEFGSVRFCFDCELLKSFVFALSVFFVWIECVALACLHWVCCFRFSCLCLLSVSFVICIEFLERNPPLVLRRECSFNLATAC